MKIGVKTFDDEKFLDHFVNKVDFFEIMAIEEKDYSFLSKFSKPIVIHAQHELFGINISDKSKYEKNIKSINFAIKLANKNNSNKIILHPGRINNSDCSLETSLSFIKIIKNNKICIENLPQTPGNIQRLCATLQETKKFLEESKTKFCLDINHAIETAIFLKKDYIEFIKEFIKLNPAHYHLGGQRINNHPQTHLALKETDFDLLEIIRLLPKDAEITLETNTNINDVENDIKIMRDLIKNC